MAYKGENLGEATLGKQTTAYQLYGHGDLSGDSFPLKRAVEGRTDGGASRFPSGRNEQNGWISTFSICRLETSSLPHSHCPFAMPFV